MSTNGSGTGKQIGLKIYFAAMIVVCGLTLGMMLYFWLYKGNKAGLYLSFFPAIVLLVYIWHWPKAAKKGFRTGVDFGNSAKKLLRSMASEDRPE